MFSNNLVLLLLFSDLSFYTYCAEKQNDLDPSQRPQELVARIKETFDKLAKTPNSTWYINGEEYYFLANIDDNKIVNTIIKENSDKQDALHFLDIGAGDFYWGSQRAKMIVKLKENELMSREKPVHIVSVRGELNNNASDKRSVQIIKHDHNVTVYNVGCFKIEDLTLELEKYELPKSFDLIFTRWTLRHLVDPVSTLVQICNSLKRKGSSFLGDGFFTTFPGAPYASWANENVETVLANSKMQYLIHHYSVQRSLNQFIIRRQPKDNGFTGIEIPLTYNKENLMHDISASAYQSNGGAVVNFTPLQGWNSNPITKEYDYTFYNDFVGKDVKGVYYGTEESQSLFDWTIENKLTDQKDDAV